MSTSRFAAAALSSLLLLSFLASSGARAAKILAVPLPGADSHLFIVTALTEELVRRGHEVLLAVSESDAETLARAPCSSKKPYTHLTTYKAAFTKKQMKERVENSRQAISNPFLGALESLVTYFQALIAYCDTEMGDAAHIDKLVDFLPDLIIGDLISPCGCGLSFKLPMIVEERGIAPPASWLRIAAARDQRKPASVLAKEEKTKPRRKELISIPRVAVSVLPVLDPLLPNLQDNLPNHLGMIPQVGTGFAAARGDVIDVDPDDGSFSNRIARLLGLLGATNRGLMPLWQRCVNVAFYFGAHAIHTLRVKPLYVALARKHGVEATTAFLHSASLTLFNTDFAIEAPRPLPPSVLFIGSLLSRPAKPLPREPWDELLGKRKGNNEPNDVIYASLGTLVTISADEYRKFAAGLALLAPIRALWKLSDADLPGNMTVSDLGLAGNVRALAWVPQNDLLGDGRLAAFVTHGGINSVNEAAFHGLPVVGIPIFGDQPDNVAKAVAGGWGVMLPLRRLSAERLSAAVRKIIGNAGKEAGNASSCSYSPSVYRSAALRVSARMRSRRRHPVSDAIDAVEGVIATDGDMYLKTGDHLVPLWRYVMLDVAAVYVAIAFLVRAGCRAVFGASSLPAAAVAPSSHSDDQSAPLKPPITPGPSPASGERRPDTAFGGGGSGSAGKLRARGAGAAAES